MKEFPECQSTYMLNKAHFKECYEASVNEDYSFRAYFKAIFFIIFGMVLVLFTDINAYMSWFIFSLGIVEALSVYYQKPWWVMRQMLSKAAQSEVTLKIDEQGIHFASFYDSQTILWEDIEQATPTTLGWLIFHNKTKHYVSNANISLDIQEYLSEKYA